MRPGTAALLASMGIAIPGPVLADGRCDLNTLVGYQVIFAKPITGYIQGGMRQRGYEGCEPDRVLVFADNTGLRCLSLGRQHLTELPNGYLFAKSKNEMALCVEGQLFEVTSTN